MVNTKSTYKASLAFLLFLVFSISIAHSSPISVELHFPKDVIYPGDLSQGYVVVKNNFNDSLTVYLQFYAEGYEAYLTQDVYTLELQGEEERKVNVYFFAPYYAKNQPYNIYVYVRKDNDEGEVLGEDKHIIYVRKSPTLKILSLALSSYTLEPGDNETVYFTIRNFGTLEGKNYSAQLFIKKRNKIWDKRVIKLPKLKPKEKVSYKETFSFNRYEDRGDYLVVLEVVDNYGDVVDRNITSFTIKAEPIFKEVEESKNYFFSKKVVVSVKNEGNEPGSKKIMISAAGWDIVYDFINVVPKVEYIDGKEYFTYTCVLKPKEECKIEYRINYWMYFLTLLILVLIIILVFIQMSKPTISKKYFRKGHKYKVILEVKNRSNKELKDVKIVDFIPGIVSMEDKQALPRPSKIKRKKDGYEVIWNLGNMKPKEVRIISYEVVPKISVVGDIEFHHAEMHALSHKGRGIKAKTKAKKHRQ